jgi:Fic family protein
MTAPAYHVDADAVAAARDVAERVRAWRGRRGVESSATARLYAWLRYAVVYHCNALEGEGLTETETKAVLIDGLTVAGKPLRDHLWAVNVAVAVARVDAWALEPGPIGERHILETSAILLRGIDEPSAGAWRRVAVYVTGAGAQQPPPPEDVPPRMAALVAWLAAPGDGEPIVQAATLLAWLAAVHPFVEGNGRAGRLLCDLMLLKRGLIRALIRDDAREPLREALRYTQQKDDLSPLVNLLTQSVGMMLAEHERASQPR